MSRNHRAAAPAQTDLEFANLGFAASMTPCTAPACEWIAENVAGETTMLGAAILIEFRFLADIVNAARADGLTCSG